jgi:hypothetical protein
MIELNGRHPYQAALSFAVEWLSALAERDFARLDALVDAAPDQGQSDFPTLSDYFKHDFGIAWPLHPNNSDEYDSWMFRLQGKNQEFHMEVEVPFPEEEFRPLLARFNLYQDGAHFLVEFVGFCFQ